MNMPAGTRFWGVPPPAAPARPQVWVTHMRPPIQARGLYSGRQHNGRPGFSGSPAGSGSHPGCLQAKPCALQHSPEMTSYWAFRPSPMGLAQNCCRGLRARTETSTYPGWCVCVPTPTPILRPQDHCEPAQVWVGAPNWQLLLHQKGTHTQPTQSTRTPGTPRGRHGRYARQGSWVGEPGGGLAHMAVCGGCTGTGENPRLTLAAGACVP